MSLKHTKQLFVKKWHKGIGAWGSCSVCPDSVLFCFSFLFCNISPRLQL